MARVDRPSRSGVKVVHVAWLGALCLHCCLCRRCIFFSDLRSLSIARSCGITPVPITFHPFFLIRKNGRAEPAYSYSSSSSSKSITPCPSFCSFILKASVPSSLIVSLNQGCWRAFLAAMRAFGSYTKILRSRSTNCLLKVDRRGIMSCGIVSAHALRRT